MNLTIIGDSVSAPARSGQWVAGQGYGALLATQYDMTEINLAVPGMNAAQIQPQWDVAQGLIIAMPGENDIPGATAGTPVSSFAATLDAQVGAAVVAGHTVVLATPFIYENATYLSAAPAYVQAIRSIAAKYRLPCVDVFSAFAELRMCDPAAYAGMVNPDGHPTIAGHVKIASLYALPQHANVPLCRCNVVPVSGWNASDKSAGVTLSADGLAAVCGVADNGVRSIIGHSSGKWFFKIRKNTGGNNVVLGLGNSSAALDYPGRFLNAWGYWAYNGHTMHNDVQAACGPALADGDTLYGYLNDGDLWFGTSSGWIGDPEAGTGAAFTGLTGELFLMFGTTNPNPVSSVTIDLSDDPMRGTAALWSDK